MDFEDRPTSDWARQAVEVCLCFHARKGARAITQVFDHALASTGLKSTQLSLLMVLKAREPINIGDLADALVTNSTTVSRTIKPLLGRKLLTLSPNTDDRRIKDVSLTAEGRLTLEGALPHWQAAQSQVARNLGNTTVQALLPALEAASRLGPADPD